MLKKTEMTLARTETMLKTIEDKYGALNKVNEDFTRQIEEQREMYHLLLNTERVTVETVIAENTNHIDSLSNVVANVWPQERVYEYGSTKCQRQERATRNETCIRERDSR